MKLFYKPGACSLASHIILKEIGSDFEIERVNTDKMLTEHGADFNAINPKGYVPVLSLGRGETLTDDTAILQYLADLKPENSLVPAFGALARARLQEHLNFISAELHKAFSPLFSSHAAAAEKLQARKQVKKKMAHFEFIFDDGRPYLLGDRFSVADAYLFVVSNWATPLGVALSQWPNIIAFSKRVAAREKVQDAMRAEGLLIK
ncbi:glutathione transferase GstA [uncultured Shewanella sp.]|uniref:glutathione transferase GstA n=1 Tax=uncultured Shewanella sp. TaxID=173975 RepID=UPI0026124CA9|nr:glutathione transferase GstA [uncultured Shewanella sp.]